MPDARCQMPDASPSDTGYPTSDIRHLSSVLPRYPQHVAGAVVVNVTARPEQEIGEPADVLDHRGGHAFVGTVTEFHDQPLGAPANGAREMQRCRGGRAAGKHERTQP